MIRFIDKKIFANIKYLSIMQIANYGLPLITMPYIIGIIGIDLFGLLSFAATVIIYFNIFIDYGFNLVATAKISKNRHNRFKINEVFIYIFFIKSIILILASIIFVALLQIPLFKEYEIVYIFSFGMVLGQLLFPVWLFQGMENLQYVSKVNIYSKILFTISIFLFIHQKEDYIYIPFLNSMSYIVMGVISLIFSIKTYQIQMVKIKKKRLLVYLRESFDIFVSNLYVKLYSNLNILLLGIFTTNTIVGYYAIAQKIIGALSGVFLPFVQSFFPHLARLHDHQYFKHFKKVYIFMLLLSMVLYITLYSFGEYIIVFLTGSENITVYQILLIMGILLFTSPLGTLFGQHFVIQKQTKAYAKIMKYTFIINLILVPGFLFYNRLYGLAYAILFTQMIHIYLNIHFFKKGQS